MAYTVCSLQGKVGHIIDLSNGSLGMFHCCPCLNICVSRTGIIFIAVLVIVPVVAATVVIMIAAGPVVTIIIIVIIISLVRRALSFFVTALGPAF